MIKYKNKTIVICLLWYILHPIYLFIWRTAAIFVFTRDSDTIIQNCKMALSQNKMVYSKLQIVVTESPHGTGLRSIHMHQGRARDVDGSCFVRGSKIEWTCSHTSDSGPGDLGFYSQSPSDIRPKQLMLNK